MAESRELEGNRHWKKIRESRLRTLFWE